MKRILASIVLIILSIGLWGCGAQERTQFDEATNQHETMQNISFQVPKAWEKKGDGENEVYYFEPENSKHKNGCAVYFLQGSDIEEEKRDAIERYQEFPGDVEVETSEIEVSNVPAISITLRQELDGDTFTNSTILIEVDNGIMMFASNAYTKVAYGDFWKVINSIVI